MKAAVPALATALAHVPLKSSILSVKSGIKFRFQRRVADVLYGVVARAR